MDNSEPTEHRKIAARMANEGRNESNASGWFETFYKWAAGEEKNIPWADLEPHPLLKSWLGVRDLAAFNNVAVVGCGLGDDAEFLSSYSSNLWAFDISSTAIEWAKKRFPHSKVDYSIGDIYNLEPDRLAQFDLVVEIYTLQAVPPELRKGAIEGLVSLVSPGGELVIISRWRNDEMVLGAVPWPLLMDEIMELKTFGLNLVEEFNSEPGEPGCWVFNKPV